MQRPPHVLARPAQGGDPGFRGRAGRPTFQTTVTLLPSEWALSARAKSRAALHCHIQHPFPIAMSSGGITRPASGAEWGCPCLPGPGRREGRARRRLPGVKPGHLHAARLRLPPPSASGTRKPRRSRVGGERGRSTACCNILPPLKQRVPTSPRRPAASSDPGMSCNRPLGFPRRLAWDIFGGQASRITILWLSRSAAGKFLRRKNGFRPRAYKKRAARARCLSSRALSGSSEHVWWLCGL